ncbi:MAG: DNA polymerase III subunit alpha [Candidatus Aminicenantes bacterium]|nr:MAG: DNA polymerase III subunit alpha [Candidatus Aminicenantes bacterium]
MFVPLRVHSVYSKGRGGATLQELASWACLRRLSSVALTDIGNLYGWGGWKRFAQDSGFVPLFGCETELHGKRFLFLVKNREGYWNLMETLNRKEIKETEGLVVVLIPQPGEEVLPENFDLSMKEDFYLGGNFFNLKRTLALAQNSDLPLVWANPLKFIKNPERLILLHSIQKKIPFPPERDKLKGRMKLFGPDQELLALKKFGSEVKTLFKNTFEVAEKCRFSFEEIVPPLPEDIFPTTLRDVVMGKLRSLKNLSWRERQRAKKELAVVEKSGFAPYFLVVHDVVEFARRRGILHNLKGSGASSFLAYLLGISRINPIEYDLYFERFLNKGRNDPPDIDLDFDSRKRDEVLSYVLSKYGQGMTGAAFVCSLKNYRARSALYETARAFGISPGEARSLSKKVPFFAEPRSLKRDKPLPGYIEIWKAASDLTSVYSENSLHVGGVILTPSPTSRYLPLGESAKGYLMAHYDRDAVEDLRLVKLDLLSVRGLAAISETKEKLKIRKIPPQDGKAYSLLKKAQTIGCFQVESPAMMNLLRRMRPENIYELTQALALIRPGPTESGMKEALLRSRGGKPVFLDSFMAKILPETGGLLLYEEQVMQIAERVAGMPPEEGDLLRRDLKRGEVDAEFKGQFFREAEERGYTPGEIKKLWKTMGEFSSYSFNKAHSASYASMAYQAVYLKTHHTIHYLTAVLNAGGGYYGLAEYIEEAKRGGIRILGPDVNRSHYQFKVEGKNIRVGFTSIKGLSLKTIDKVIEERKHGEYLSIEDFLCRVPSTKTELLSFIKAGVFDSLEPRRTRQILCYFRGLEDMEEVSDLDQNQKEKMLIESLGFAPEGDSLSLFEGKRPPLRVKDLRDYVGREVELVVRMVDARQKKVSRGQKYFFLFEDETGLLEGVGDSKCLTFGSPPACYLRGEVRSDGGGRPKIFNCSFLMGSRLTI